ncbi:RTA1 domain [Pyrenophora seminiperda CCB06]|uniref:RTA1 domain n=1 Tax=Pyrenophora seminiperda CCB06 TaxID=1302712 RepID=A0A3M7MDT2_9PLEO|nr:RTA1 domain [Pyrenophora seminiperda CCB06]
MSACTGLAITVIDDDKDSVFWVTGIEVSRSGTEDAGQDGGSGRPFRCAICGLAKKGHSYVQKIINPYIYKPSCALAIVGVAIVVLLSLYSFSQYARHRSWFFWTAIIAILMLDLGFITRLVSAYDEEKEDPFLISWLMILLAPSFLAAASYTAFSRVIWFSCPNHALNFETLWCFPRWITSTFVTFDLFSFVIQLIGASQISKEYDHSPAGSRTISSSERQAIPGRVILVLGLVLQMMCFISFSIISIRYFYLSRHWTAHDLGDMHLWRKLSYTINLSSVLIALRAVYRTMEIPHDRGYGLLYLQTHEWCFWVFDAAPILLVLAVFAIWHPGRYLPRTYTRLALNKTRAVQEKDELGSMDCGAKGGEVVELKNYRPEDFQSGRAGENV